MIKKEIAKAPVLAYYDPKKDRVLQTDTSFKGLGACLMQQGKLYTLPVKASLKPKKDM